MVFKDLIYSIISYSSNEESVFTDAAWLIWPKYQK